MAASQENPIVFTGMRGRDGSTASTFLVPKHKFREAINIDCYRAGFARKRGGSTNIYSTTTSEALTGEVVGLIRHVPGANAGAAELWAFDNEILIQRLAGGTVWATVDPFNNEDLTQANAHQVVGASFNGKLFLAYDSSTDRLHVWDGDEIRRTGFTAPVAATVANTGSGTYAATLRSYKVAWAELSGSTILRRSELGPNVDFTPSGTGTAARVTKPTASSPAEGETHWILYGSADGQTYFKLATTAVATTTYDDSTAPGSYTGDAPPTAGTHTNWTSVRYVVSTGNSLVGLGAWETAGARYNRVWYSAFLGQTGEGDDEAVPQTADVNNYVDLDENDGGEGTGLGLLGSRIIVFKRNQTWQLIPTGLDNPVYLPREIFKGSGLGCIRHHTIVAAVDEAGRPALYWLSDTGPYRVGANGPQAMVDDIQDVWDTINLGASNVGHGIYHSAKKQIWWWMAVNSSDTPNKLMIFDVQQGRANDLGRVVDGWYEFTGPLASALCSCMYSNTLGATMSSDLKPHVGRDTGVVILKADTADTDDAGTNFQAYGELPDRHYAGIGKKATLGNVVILGNAGTQSIQVTVTPNYGERAGITDSVAMTAVGSETRALRTWEDSAYGDDAYAHRLRVGDSAAADATWTIDAVVVPFEVRDAVNQA